MSTSIQVVENGRFFWASQTHKSIYVWLEQLTEN